MPKKKLTAREKKLRAEVKKDMQKEGLIAPDKKRLNRKKFISDAEKAFDESKDVHIYDPCIAKAIGFMLQHMDRNFNASLEAVGAAKVLALAVRLKEFYKKVESEGRKTYTIQEEFDYIKDILEA